MAKGGGKRRTYTRDASGRFASSPGGGGRGKATTSRSPRRAARRPQVTGGTLAARSSLRRSRAKLQATPTAAQQGAVTRGTKRLRDARRTATRRMAGPAGVLRKPKRRMTLRGAVAFDRQMTRFQARALTDRFKGGVDGEMARITLRTMGSGSGRVQIERRARRAADLAARGSKVAARAGAVYDNQLAAMGPGKAPRAKNNIRPTRVGAPGNRIRPYDPATISGRQDQLIRKMGKAAEEMRDSARKVKPLVNQAKGLQRQVERSAARDIARRSAPGARGRVARIMVANQGGQLNMAGLDVIRRRGERAAAVAGRGRAVGRKAQAIYDQQLAYAGRGGVKRGAKNNLRPGPRNTSGGPKRKGKGKRGKKGS